MSTLKDLQALPIGLIMESMYTAMDEADRKTTHDLYKVMHSAIDADSIGQQVQLKHLCLASLFLANAAVLLLSGKDHTTRLTAEQLEAMSLATGLVN